MRMETDQLIRTLAADNAHRARPVGLVLALSLLAGAPFEKEMYGDWDKSQYGLKTAHVAIRRTSG